jgi:threonine synthase
MIPDFKYSSKPVNNFPYVKEWISIGEVETPILQKSDTLFKLDYFQPTFSYKDRGSRVMISYLRGVSDQFGIREINEDSSGNAGSSIAAYGIAAGFSVNIFVPKQTVKNKIEQIRMYGANIYEITGSREDVSVAAMKNKGIYASHVYTPEFRDGIRSLSYEVFEQTSGSIPETLFLPTSAGTLAIGVVEGFIHLLGSGEIESMPRIVMVQPEVISPICDRLNGKERSTPYGRSIADALITRNSPLIEIIESRISKYVDCVSVSEDEIVRSRQSLARAGMIVEFSSAVAYAGMLKYRPKTRSMVVLTGNGLKNFS